MAEPTEPTRRNVLAALMGAAAAGTGITPATAQVPAETPQEDLRGRLGRHQVSEGVRPGRVHLDIALPQARSREDAENMIGPLIREMQRRGLSVDSGYGGSEMYVRNLREEDPGSQPNGSGHRRLVTAGSMEYMGGSDFNNRVRGDRPMSGLFNNSPVTDNERHSYAARNGYRGERVVSLNIDTNGENPADIVRRADAAYRGLHRDTQLDMQPLHTAPTRQP